MLLRQGGGGASVSRIRPYHVLADADNQPQTTALIRAVSLQVLQAVVKIYALVTPAAGIFSLLLAVGFWPRRLMRYLILIIVAALVVAVLRRRSFLLALIHISSFPAIFHVRMLPTEPLAICAALLAIYLFISLARKNLWCHRSSSS